MKTIRNVTTYDDLLHAIPPGKVLVTGTCWTGEIAPQIDATLAAIGTLSTGFMSGNVLHAEPAPTELNLGRLWVGQLRDQIAQAARDARGAPISAGEKIDATEALQAVESVRNAMGAPKPNFGVIADGLRRLKRAKDDLGEAFSAVSSDVSAATSAASAVTTAARSSGNASRAGTADEPELGRKTAAKALDHARVSTQNALARIRAAASAHWNDSSSHPYLHDVDAHARQSNGEVRTRDAAVPPPIARAPAASPFTTTVRSQRGSGSIPVSPAELNERNRRHWEGK